MTKNKNKRTANLAGKNKPTITIEEINVARARNRRRNRVMAPVAVGQPGLGRQTNGIVVTGRDRLLHIPDVSIFPEQTVITSDVFAANSVSRLDKLTDAYTRWDVLSLRFHVEPQISTAVSGGYVAGFDPDPDTVIPPGEDGLNAITALSGSITKKWWQGGVVGMPREKDDLFTKLNDSELRWSSPGRFVLASDGKATTPGSLTVYVEWSVRLTKPQLQVQPVNPDPVPTAKTATGVWYSDDGEHTFISGVHDNVTEPSRISLLLTFPTLPLTKWADEGKIFTFRKPYYCPHANVAAGANLLLGFTFHTMKVEHSTYGIVFQVFERHAESLIPQVTAGVKEGDLTTLPLTLFAPWVVGTPFNFYDFEEFEEETELLKLSKRSSEFRCYKPK